MRNPDRLDDFYVELCRIHKEHFPDWRYGQLCSNFLGWLMGEKKRDCFFPEEDEMLHWLKVYCGEEEDKPYRGTRAQSGVIDEAFWGEKDLFDDSDSYNTLIPEEYKDDK